MEEYETLNHTTWDRKYHVVFIPKYRRKVLYQELRKALVEVFRQLASQKEAKVEGRGICCPIMFICSCRFRRSIRFPAWWVTSRAGAIYLARTYGERKRNFVGQNFWARGYFVSTVGRDETAIRDYIKQQEKEDQRLGQLNLWR
jgi:putative transposase